MVIPGLVAVINDSSSKASSGVDTGAGNRNCCQVDHEHSESDGKWCQNLYIKFNSERKMIIHVNKEKERKDMR